MDYKKELESGRALTIIPSDLDYEIAVFWKTGDNIFSWNRVLGLMKRDDLDLDKLVQHLENMKDLNDQIYARGRED